MASLPSFDAGKGYPRNLVSVVSPPTAFMVPALLPESAWSQHIPFAFWITEQHRPRTIVELGTHRGASYFAFCQAVAHLGLATRCYAVDTWKGDEHSGHYGEDVYAAVEQHNSALYSGFSTLMRMRFSDGLDYFPDGEIDLLHIDGLHTYEAAREDFESWLPKLSDRGIVLFHDTNVRRSQFGVFRLMVELRARYPVFEFFHGHGLGVVAVGRDSVADLTTLFAEEDADFATQQEFREIFSRLGKACEDSQKGAAAQTDLGRTKRVGAKRDEQLDAALARLESLEAVHAERDTVLARTNETLVSLETLILQLAEATDTIAATRETLAERDALLTRTNQSLVSLEKLITQRAEATDALAAARATLAERDAALEAARTTLSERDAVLTRTNETLVSLEKLILQRAEANDTIALRGQHLEMLGDYVLRGRAPSFLSLGYRLRLIRDRRRLLRSKLFNADWYLKTYPDVAKRQKDPALHYLTHGAYKGRDPGPNFSTIGYLLDHMDVRRAGTNPLLHYLRYGKNEDRKIRKAADRV